MDSWLRGRVEISQPSESRYTSHSSCMSMSCRTRTSDSALWDDSVARTVSVGQHLSTSYPVVTVTLVIDAIQACGGHSADYAETLGRSFTCQTVLKMVEVPQSQFRS